jgi:hypothetical protein
LGHSENFPKAFANQEISEPRYSLQSFSVAAALLPPPKKDFHCYRLSRNTASKQLPIFH